MDNLETLRRYKTMMWLMMKVQVIGVIGVVIPIIKIEWWGFLFNFCYMYATNLLNAQRSGMISPLFYPIVYCTTCTTYAL